MFDPVQRVIGDRGTYVAACLTIVRAYLLAGCPGKLPQLASFGAWSDLVRSALVWLGCADPAQSIQRSPAQRSCARYDAPGASMLALMLTARGQTAARSQRTVANFDPSTEKGDALLALRASLAPAASDRGQIDASKLGYWLRKNKDRIVDGQKFAVVGEPHGVAEWAVRTG